MSLSTRERLKIRCRKTARRTYWSYFEKEAHACRGCGRGGVGLDVHHRDGDWLNNALYNLVALCHRCHRRAHRIRNVTARVDTMRSELAEITA